MNAVSRGDVIKTPCSVPSTDSLGSSPRNSRCLMLAGQVRLFLDRTNVYNGKPSATAAVGLRAKALRIILVVVLFVVFFEIGLFSSYTIVAAEAPDIEGLIDMQISKITGIFNSDNVNNVLVKDPTVVNITNKRDVAQSLEDLSKVDGVNVDSMNVTTYDDKDNEELNVTIEALGYASPSSNSSQIVISQDPSYKIVAEGNATFKGGSLVVDVDSITIQSILKLY